MLPSICHLQPQPGSTAPAQAQALCLQQPAGGLLAAGLLLAGLATHGQRRRREAAPAAERKRRLPPQGSDARRLPPLLPRAKPPHRGGRPAGQHRLRRQRRPKGEPTCSDACRRYSRGRNPPHRGGRLAGQHRPRRRRRPKRAPTRSGIAASGRAACRRGQCPRPAAQAAAGRVAAAAQQRKGERVLGFSVQKTVLPLGI